jgi:hypothetical protein
LFSSFAQARGPGASMPPSGIEPSWRLVFPAFGARGGSGARFANAVFTARLALELAISAVPELAASLPAIIFGASLRGAGKNA